MFCAYAIKNSINNRIYIGQTDNLEERLKRHNGFLPTKEKSFTFKNRQRGLWEVFYKEEFPTRQEAIAREKELKSFQGRLFLKSKLK
jgi:putative endonuclease